MNLIDFNRQFPNEEACRQHLKAVREQQGVVCSKCGHAHHYWKGYRNQWQCKRCGHRTSLTSGTVMHGTKLPLLYWFIAIHLLTSTKNTFSASELQRQLGHKAYQPIWEMLHKLRSVMGERDGQYTLEGVIELDEGFFTIDCDANTPRHRGRGSEAKAKVLVMAESRPNEEARGRRINRAIRHIKMRVIPNLRAETIDEEVMGAIEPNSELITDNSTSYVHFGDMVERHQAQVIPPREVGNVLPWVHIVISNAKRQLLDVFHSVDEDYLQSYLDEFCYKFNRRYLDLFERLMVASISYQNRFMHRTYVRNVA